MTRKKWEMRLSRQGLDNEGVENSSNRPAVFERNILIFKHSFRVQGEIRWMGLQTSLLLWVNRHPFIHFMYWGSRQHFIENHCYKQWELPRNVIQVFSRTELIRICFTKSVLNCFNVFLFWKPHHQFLKDKEKWK